MANGEDNGNVPVTAEATAKTLLDLKRLKWSDVVKAGLAVHVASAAQRVLSQRPASPAPAGRKGGAVAGTAPAVRAKAPARPSAKPQASAEAEACPAPTGVVPIAKATFKEFGADNGTLMAASVAFYLMLSIVPLLLVAISLLGMVLHDNAGAQTRVMGFLHQFLPGQAKGAGGEELLNNAVQSVISARGTIRSIGLIGLLSTALGGFATLETAINAIWRTPNRNFIWNKVFALGMMAVIGVLFACSIGVTWAVNLAGALPMLGWLRGWGLQLLGHVLPIAISGLMFSMIYKFFPNVKTEWKPALISGFITAVLWEIAKIAYAYYTTRFGDQSATYGTLGGFVGLIMWIYYSSALVLLGAELTWILNGCPRGDAPKPGSADQAPAIGSA